MQRFLRLPSERLVRFAFFGALIAWTMVAGKDISWDVVNHQFYLPFSWVTGRFRTDLFGAGPQSYQNPLGYFPLYGLFRLGLPAWGIGVVLGALHALAVWPLDRIARLFWPRGTEGDFWLRTLALAFCCIAPVFLIHEGTTSVDPITNLLVLWGMALSLEAAAQDGPGLRRAAIAGACLGLASALKLSNAPFAVVSCVVWALQWATGQRGVRQIGAFAAGLGLSFALAAGPWMWWLWQDFRNPIFPLYNNVFHSPYAPPQAIMALRFIPTSFGEAISRVWELAKLSTFVSYESFLPDFRPALAAGAAVIAAVLIAARGGWRRLATLEAWRSPGAQLALLMVLSYVLWIRSSGNARYGMPLFVVLGIALVRAVQLCLPLKPAKVLLLTALLLQGAYYGSGGEYRFLGTSWDAGPYLDYRVPRRLQEQPFLHLTLGTQTDASVALFLDPRGALANPIGQFALPTEGPLGQRLEALLARWHGRTRFLLPALHATDPVDVQHAHEGATRLLYRLGLDIDWNDCETIELVPSRSAEQEDPTRERSSATSIQHLSSCAAIDRPQRDPVVDAQRAQADRVFAILEAACPKIFSPTPFSSEHGYGLWQRHYANTEALLSVSVTQGVTYAHFRSIDLATFGSIDDVLQHRRSITCPKPSYQTPT
jgi:hypothetical protein